MIKMSTDVTLVKHSEWDENKTAKSNPKNTPQNNKANTKAVKRYTVCVRAPHHDDHNVDHLACLNYTHDHNHRDDLPCARTHTVITLLNKSLHH